MVTIESQEEGIKLFEAGYFPVFIVPRIVKRDLVLYAKPKAELCSVGFKVNKISYALACEAVIKPFIYINDRTPHPASRQLPRKYKRGPSKESYKI